MLLCLAGGVLGAGSGDERPPWVVIYVVDTFRYDDLVSSTPGGAESIAGVPGGFARLVRDGTLFERAFSTTSWTRPAVASLLTGLPASGHGIHDIADGLRDGVPLLAERLQERGYRTLAVSSNPNALPRWGFGRGFDRFLDTPPSYVIGEPVGYDDLLAAALEAVQAKSEAPLFLYVHDNGPHSPYSARAAIKERFGVRDAPREAALHANASSPEITRQALGLHRAAVHQTSERLAAVLDAIESAGHYDDAIVILVGDHGEEFGEHGGTRHARTLYQEQLHVPLVVKAAALGVGRISTPVSIADIAPSVVSWVDAAALAETVASQPLAAGSAPDRAILAELETEKHSGVTVIEWPWKYTRRASKAGPGSLYDLERDPGERRDVAASHPDVALRLRRRAERMRAEGLGGLTLACVAGSSREHVSLTLWLGREVSALDGLALEPKDDVEPRLDGEGRMTGASLRCALPPQNFDRGPQRPRDRDGLRVRTQEGGGRGSWVRIDPKGVLSQPPVFGPGNERLVPGRAIPLRSIRSRRILPSLTHRGPRPVCRLHYYEPPETPRPAVEPELMERLRALGYAE